MSQGDGPLLGGGGFFGRMNEYGPRGPYGAWPSCGCGSLFLIIGGILVACGGFLTMFEGMFR